ncbi:hypothetical protein QFZ71_005509 [Streptomyces sp. V2I9]|nr:hypothetical protein [Streptomyces sp. V2I9]
MPTPASSRAVEETYAGGPYRAGAVAGAPARSGRLEARTDGWTRPEASGVSDLLPSDEIVRSRRGSVGLEHQGEHARQSLLQRIRVQGSYHRS